MVKPETGEYPDLVVNEVACTAALRRLGLPLAPLEPMTIAGRPCAVAARLDRRGDGLPATPRHQETFWQALGFAPGAERAAEELERPGFLHSAELLRAIGEEDAVETLFKLGFACFLLGDHAEDIADGSRCRRSRPRSRWPPCSAAPSAPSPNGPRSAAGTAR